MAIDYNYTGSQKLRNILPKMALMITLHHKYVQLSSCNLAFPIRSTVGVIMMLGIWASISIILQYMLFVMLCGLHEQQHNCFNNCSDSLYC